MNGIDNTRNNIVIAIGVALVVLAALAVSNIEQARLSAHFDFPYRPYVAAALFVVGAVSGVLAMLRALARQRMPWRVPQAQANILFIIFFVTTLTAVVMAK
jgi:uncharacterized membrane protein